MRPQTSIDRRLFLAGLLGTATVGPAFGQSIVEAEFKPKYRELLDRFESAHPGVILDSRIVTLAGNVRPWLDTGLDIAKGDEMTLFAAGRIHVSRAANLFLLPRVVLWARIGEENIFRPGSDTFSFKSDSTGDLRLATSQGRWATRQGDHPSPATYDKVEGSMDVLLVRWGKVTAEKGLALLAELAPSDQLIAAERRRLRTPLRMPSGFEELWYAGSGANFTETHFDGEPAIALRSEFDAGIIRAPLDMSLEEGIDMQWDWRVNSLPSVRAEDALPFHQYASVALEFDDGQDLSWYWSAALEKGKHYPCPLPSWPGETHLVVRSGASDQTRWVTEKRDVHADVATALKRKPTRVTGVWLIAMTAMGQRPASADFRRIAITDGSGKRHRIFPA